VAEDVMSPQEQMRRATEDRAEPFKGGPEGAPNKRSMGRVQGSPVLREYSKTPGASPGSPPPSPKVYPSPAGPTMFSRKGGVVRRVGKRGK
jgi:hypothetical protein